MGTAQSDRQSRLNVLLTHKCESQRYLVRQFINFLWLFRILVGQSLRDIPLEELAVIILDSLRSDLFKPIFMGHFLQVTHSPNMAVDDNDEAQSENHLDSLLDV